jgi:uncharacterized protein with NRDE domain
MCLLLVAIDAVPGVPLLLLGNRDEFHARASAPAQPWRDDLRVVGGRDLVAGGSWLALRDDGRFAAVTNLRTGVPATAPHSRGALVRDFVTGDRGPGAFVDALRAGMGEYGPFNLVVGDRDGVFALGSGDGIVRRFDAGVHLVSNGAIGVHWPKTERLRERFIAQIAAEYDESRLLDLLLDEQQPVDALLPETGVGPELERRLAPIFIRGDRYGTRAASLVSRRTDGALVLRERGFGAEAAFEDESRWQATPGQGFRQTP